MVQTERPSESVETPAPRPSPAPAVRSLTRLGAAVVIVALVAGALLLVQLGSQQRGGPPHRDVVIEGGIPLTLYVPGDTPRDFQDLPDPAPAGQRPPVVLLAHGFTADRNTMSVMARSLAAAGYAVAAIDFRGHGANRNPFGEGGSDLRADLDRVVDWLGREPHVDPSRLVLMGHSMGASAVLDFATVDPRPAAVVAISGGDTVDGRYSPKHVMFIAASGDPSGIRDTQVALDRRLRAEGVPTARTVVPDTDHATILFSGVAVKRMVAYTNDVFGIRAGDATRADARLGTSGLYFLCALVLLAALGVAAGRLVPRMATASVGPVGGGFAVLAGALFLTMPLLAVVVPVSFIPLEVGDSQASQVGLVAALVLLLGAWRQRGGLPWLKPEWLGGERTIRGDLRGVVPVAVGTFVAIYLLLVPFGAVYHRLALPPPRLLIGAVMAVVIFPFFLVLERLTRRGGPVTGSLLGLGAKALILVITLVGVVVGVLPGVLIVLLPILALIFVLIEVFAAGAYTVSRNIALIAVVEALWFAWISASSLPIRI